MKIAVDGLIYNLQQAGGISRMFNEIMPRVCDLDREAEFFVLLNRKPKQEISVHERIHQLTNYRLKRFLKPRKLLGGLSARIIDEVSLAQIGDSRRAIWHSTFFTRPRRWRGVTVVSVYDLVHERYQDTLFKTDADQKVRDAKQAAIKHADQVISISESTKLDMIERYGLSPEKITVIPLACSTIFFEPPQQNLIGRPYLLYVGDRTRHKNFLGLLDAFCVWQRAGEVVLVAAGRPWSDEEAREIDRRGLADKVFQQPNPSDEDLRDLYANALAFVYPSLYEGFGIPLLEAMSCGCPILASRIPTSVEVAGQIPVYHEPGDTISLLASFDLLSESDTLAKKASAGRDCARQYSWDRTAALTIDLYNSLL